MKLLAWDTSSKAGAIVALEWTSARDWASVRVAGELNLSVDSQHSDGLLWGIHQVLESAGWQLSDVDVFAVGVGPGSFTGLRIGVTTARTLAHVLGKPLIGLSSLAALTKGRPDLLVEDCVIVVATDACKGELFALLGDGQERVLSPDDLVREIAAKLGPQSKWLVIGEGRKRYPEVWAKLPAERELKIELSDHVQARALGRLAWEASCAGLAVDALEVHPRYLRASDAEVKLRAGLLPVASMSAPFGDAE